MSALVDYNSDEKEILINIFDQVGSCDKWIANIVESYIYSDKSKITDGKRYNYRTRFGQKDGPFKAYFVKSQSESLLIDSTYKNGALNGEYKYYYSTTDGNQLMEQCFYKDGKRHGEYKCWLDSGKLLSHRLYENGIIKKDFLKSD